MTPQSSRYTSSGDLSVYAGEALAIELVILRDGVPIDPTGRKGALTLWRTTNRVPILDPIPGETIDGTDATHGAVKLLRYVLPGSATDLVFTKHRTDCGYQIASANADGLDYRLIGKVLPKASASLGAVTGPGEPPVVALSLETRTQQIVVDARGAPGATPAEQLYAAGIIPAPTPEALATFLAMPAVDAADLLAASRVSGAGLVQGDTSAIESPVLRVDEATEEDTLAGSDVRAAVTPRRAKVLVDTASAAVLAFAGAGLERRVRTDASQDLPVYDQQIARTNIGAIGTTELDFSVGEEARAREAAVNGFTTFAEYALDRRIRFDLPQVLAPEESDTARTNIGAPSAVITDYRYASRADAAAATIPTAAQQVAITGFAIFGDALRSVWKRVAVQPTHPARFRSQDRFLPDGTTSADAGGWWELAEDHARPEWLGDPANPQAGLEAALAACRTLGVPLKLLGRKYAVTATLLNALVTSGVALQGEGQHLTSLEQIDGVWSRVLRFEGDATYQQLFQAGVATAASKVVTGIADTSKLVVGMPVSGRYIPAGTVIQSIDGAGQITLSKAVVRTTAIGMVFRPLVDNRPSLSLRGFTIGRPNVTAYKGAVGPQTLSIDYFKRVELDDIGIVGSIGWGLTLAYCEDVRITNARVRDSLAKTGTDGINCYKCCKVVIEGAIVTNVGDDPISAGSYDQAWPMDEFLIVNCYVYNSKGSIKVYGGARNGRIHNCWSFGTENGCVGLWNDRPGVQAIGMYNIYITNCHSFGSGLIGSLGAFNIYSSVPGGTAIPGDALTYMEDIFLIGCTAKGGQYGLSIYSNPDVIQTKRARRITVQGCSFSDHTLDGINALGVDDFLTIEGGAIRDVAGRPIFIKDAMDGLKLTIGAGLKIDGFLSNAAVTTGVAAIFVSTAKNLLLDVRAKVANNRRGSLVQPVRTEATTLHPLSILDVDSDATFDAQAQLVGWRGTGAKRVTGGAARITTAGFTYQTGQAYSYPLAASGAVPGDNVKEGGTLGTLYAADGVTGVTITTTADSKVAVVSDATNIFVGSWMSIAGLASYFIVTDVSGTTVQLHRVPGATLAGVALAYYAPTLVALPAVVASGGGSAPFPTDGNSYLIDLDSLVGQGHQVIFTTPVPRLLGASGQSVKIRFTDAWHFEVRWLIERVGDPRDNYYLLETIRYVAAAPSAGVQGIDWCQEAASVYAVRKQQLFDGALVGSFKMTCPNFGGSHPPVELVYTPPVTSPTRDYNVVATIVANKSGGN